MPTTSPNRLCAFACGLVCLIACERDAQPGTPRADFAAPSQNPPKTPRVTFPAMQCFADGDHSLCLPASERPEPLVVHVDGHALPFLGEWTPRGARAPKLAGTLLDEQGPELATGPNGALRIGCDGRFRQFFKAELLPEGGFAHSTESRQFTPGGLCHYLGVGG